MLESYAIRWKEACDAKRRHDAEASVSSARRLLRFSPDELAWLREALHSNERRWFVAAIFEKHSVPRALLSDMITAGVQVHEASFCRSFIEPCLATFGRSEIQPLVESF